MGIGDRSGVKPSQTSLGRILALALAALMFGLSAVAILSPDDVFGTHLGPCGFLNVKTASFPPDPSGTYHAGPNAQAFEVDIPFRRGPSPAPNEFGAGAAETRR